MMGREYMDLETGRLVFSKAGRDKGLAFVIVEVLDSQYVYIADGHLRTIKKPKKKKTKHLIGTSTIFHTLKVKLDQKIEIYDKELRKILEVWNRNL
jgi:ribosomal protein L14E/L6E/L27E